MALGLPDNPPEDIDFAESRDDETCPNCGWDREEAAEDPQRAFNSGILLAVELAEASPFTVASGTTLMGFYWRCLDCQTHFTTEEESAHMGAMS